MKKYTFMLLAAVALFSLASCQKEEGTEPGTTSEPTAVLFTYAADDDDHDPDSDFRVRIATNNQAQKVYLFYEDTASYNANIASLGKDGYAKYVVEHGTEVAGATAGTVTDTYVTGVNGYVNISVAAVSGGKTTVKTARVLGILWQTLAEGRYLVQYQNRPLAGIMGGYVFNTTFQQNPMNPKQYRYKDLFGKGYHMILNLTGEGGEDADGVYSNFSMSGTATPFSYGNYGTIYCATYADHTGDTSYYDYTYLYEDNTMYSYNRYYVSAGYLCSGYDAFIPN